MRSNHKTIGTSILLFLLTAAIYATLLGYRGDYLRHWSSGFGGTLGLLMFVFAILPAAQFKEWSRIVVVPICLASIALGAALEASAFRLAKFDEIDFFNQSLGAVLAVLLGWAVTHDSKPAARFLIVAIAGSLLIVLLGLIDAAR